MHELRCSARTGWLYLFVDGREKRGQAFMEGAPNVVFLDIVVIVPVDITHAHDGAPGQFGRRACNSGGSRRAASEIISSARVTA